MTKASFEEAAKNWLQDEASAVRSVLRAAKGVFYNKAPQRFRFFGALHWTAKTGLAASAPVFGWYYGSIKTISTVVIATIAIAGANSIIAIFDTMSREKAAAPSEGQTDIINRFGELLSAHRAKKSIAATDKDDAIRACLGIVEIFSRQTTKSKNGDVSVSLVLYQGKSRTKLTIRHRNPGNVRPTGREINAAGLLGHYVCEFGTLPQVLHDTKELAHRVASPTQSKAEYRSIFFYPLEVASGEGKFVKGFISIDCKKPYAFYGNRANDIVVTCEPVLSHIKELIQEPKNARDA